MTEIQVLKNISDEMELVVIPKAEKNSVCLACGPRDPQPIGESRYMLNFSYSDAEGQPDWEYVEFCPKHLALLLTLGLTHIMRVDRGKEEGPLKLSMLGKVA